MFNYVKLLPVRGARITQRFGENYEYYHKKFGIDGHNGIDFSCHEGTPVSTVDDGVITEMREDPDGYGKYLKVIHSWGHTLYGHLASYAGKEGDVVKSGVVIGYSGNTGNSTGPHLHFGMRVKPYSSGNDRFWVNPMPYFDELMWDKNKTILSPHWITNNSPWLVNYLSQWNPRFVLLFKGLWGSNDFMKTMFSSFPNSIFILRDYDMSEQKLDMASNPKGTGKRHANEWNEKLQAMQGVDGFNKDKIIVLGINEPAVWEKRNETVVYTNSFLGELTKNGLRGGAYNFSVGWPGNEGVKDAPPNWEPYSSSEKVIMKGGHYLMMHLYWAEKGPSVNSEWWAGSNKYCPWEKVPIVAGECGIDMGVVGKRNLGWASVVSPFEYVQQLKEADSLWKEDKRMKGACIFTVGTESGDWESFRIDRKDILDLLVKYAKTKKKVLPKETGTDSSNIFILRAKDYSFLKRDIEIREI